MRRPSSQTLRIPMFPPKHLFSRRAVRLMSGLALAMAALNTGCISTEKTVYQEQDRVKVELENDTAGRLFYEALSKLPSRHGRRESKPERSIPRGSDHRRRASER